MHIKSKSTLLFSGYIFNFNLGVRNHPGPEKEKELVIKKTFNLK
jgi:hypothetical protein